MLALIGTWIALLGQLAAPAAPCCPDGVCATPLVVKVAATPDPVAEAYTRLSADLAVLSKAQAAVAALAQANARLKAAQDALVASKAALVDAIDAASSNVPVPPAKIVSLLVISNTTSCAPCRTLMPVLDKLRAEGIPIVVLPDELAVTQKWKVVATPTIVMLVGDSEVSRSAGSQGEAALKDWYNATVAWSKKTK